MITRRSLLLAGVAGALAAPAIIRVAKLMPVRRIPVRFGPQRTLVYDGDIAWPGLRNRTIVFPSEPLDLALGHAGNEPVRVGGINVLLGHRT